VTWIRIETDLEAHHKVAKLARLTGERNAGVYLLRLWSWAARCARDGNLENVDIEDIATACRWEGAAETLVAALVAARWLDRDSTYVAGDLKTGETMVHPSSLVIHEWWEYQGQHIFKALRDAQRKRHLRAGADQDEETAGARQAPGPGAAQERRAPGARRGEDGRAPLRGQSSDGPAPGARTAQVRNGEDGEDKQNRPSPVDGDGVCRTHARPSPATPAATGPDSEVQTPGSEGPVQAIGRIYRGLGLAPPPLAALERWLTRAGSGQALVTVIQDLASRGGLEKGQPYVWRTIERVASGEPLGFPSPAPRNLPEPEDAETILNRERVLAVLDLEPLFSRTPDPDDTRDAFRDEIFATTSSEDVGRVKARWRADLAHSPGPLCV
jgi:hypothetical protein